MKRIERLQTSMVMDAGHFRAVMKSAAGSQSEGQVGGDAPGNSRACFTVAIGVVQAGHAFVLRASSRRRTASAIDRIPVGSNHLYGPAIDRFRALRFIPQHENGFAERRPFFLHPA